jgi:hypothetical protein
LFKNDIKLRRRASNIAEQLIAALQEIYPHNSPEFVKLEPLVKKLSTLQSELSSDKELVEIPAGPNKWAVRELFWSDLLELWTRVLGRPPSSSVGGPLNRFLLAASKPASDKIRPTAHAAHEFVEKYRDRLDPLQSGYFLHPRPRKKTKAFRPVGFAQNSYHCRQCPNFMMLPNGVESTCVGAAKSIPHIASAEAPRPLSVTVQAACKLIGVGNTKMWALIKEGRVKTTSIAAQRGDNHAWPLASLISERNSKTACRTLANRFQLQTVSASAK